MVNRVSSNTQYKYQHTLCSSNSTLLGPCSQNAQTKASDSMSARLQCSTDWTQADVRQQNSPNPGPHKGTRKKDPTGCLHVGCWDKQPACRVHTARPTQLRRQRVYKHTCALMSKGKPRKYKWKYEGWDQWSTPVIPASGRWRWFHGFKVSCG